MRTKFLRKATGANDKAQPVSNCMQHSSFSICKGTEISKVNNELTSNTVNKSLRNSASESSLCSTRLFCVLSFLQTRAISQCVYIYCKQHSEIYTCFENVQYFHKNNTRMNIFGMRVAMVFDFVDFVDSYYYPSNAQIHPQVLYHFELLKSLYKQLHQQWRLLMHLEKYGLH